MVCCAGDLLINPTSLVALTLPAMPLSNHYPPFVFVRGQMLSPVKLSLLSLKYLHAGFKWSDFFEKITD